MRVWKSPHGFTILELLIGMFLSALLVTGVTALVSSSVAAYRQQLAQGQLGESGRFAPETMYTQISQAGYHPRPWQGSLPALTLDSANGASVAGDRLGLQRWSARNCYGNQNPAVDAEGRPEFYLLQTRFHVNTDNDLVMTCRYGPDASRLTTQVNNFGLVENVESLQALYAQDRNGDNTADGWVRAGSWSDERQVLAVKIGLLLASPRAAYPRTPRPVTLLDETFAAPADGRLREVAILTAAIRGRLN